MDGYALEGMDEYDVELAPTVNTPEEWEAYVKGLNEEELWSQAVAANTTRFTQNLIGEGYGLDEVENIMRMFARRFRELDIRMPTMGAFELRDLA